MTGMALVIPFATTTPLKGALSSMRGERVGAGGVRRLDAVADEVAGAGARDGGGVGVTAVAVIGVVCWAPKSMMYRTTALVCPVIVAVTVTAWLAAGTFGVAVTRGDVRLQAGGRHRVRCAGGAAGRRRSRPPS